MLVIPRTKQIASRMFDFPDPFRPVMALKDSSKPGLQLQHTLVYGNRHTGDGRPHGVRLEACK
jgi:hypothetical protein